MRYTATCSCTIQVHLYARGATTYLFRPRVTLAALRRPILSDVVEEALSSPFQDGACKALIRAIRLRRVSNNKRFHWVCLSRYPTGSRRRVVCVCIGIHAATVVALTVEKSKTVREVRGTNGTLSAVSSEHCMQFDSPCSDNEQQTSLFALSLHHCRHGQQHTRGLTNLLSTDNRDANGMQTIISSFCERRFSNSIQTEFKFSRISQTVFLLSPVKLTRAVIEIMKRMIQGVCKVQ